LEQDASEAMVNWQELEAERRWAYALCDWVVDASLSPEDAAREIGSWWVNTHGSSTKEDRPWQARHLLVAVEGEPYPIHFGHGILGNLGQRCRREIGLKQALVVSNPTVFALYGQLVEESLAVAGVQYETVLIPDGEVHKHLATVESIYAAALDAGMDRRSGIIALGGGVVGDVAGFAAATYMRGIKLVQVPTTLLAQVDSSVGGKVGVNHPRGKNLIGAFYQPQLVVADLDTLETLPRRQFLTGMAEVIKYACIYDMALMEELERYGGREVPKAVLAAWVKRSCEIKAQVVAVDAKEMGYREILNFGHTVGHAVEQVAGYGKYTHGEAVAMGMVTATVLSSLKGYLPEHACKRIIQLLREWHLPIDLGMLPLTSIAEACGVDKKARFGELRFVLLHGLGNAQPAEIITPGELLQALEIQQGGFP
jgi:3-dehydroquinate synthase